MTSHRPTYIHTFFTIILLIPCFNTVCEVQTSSLLSVCCYVLLLWQNSCQERRNTLKSSDNLCQEDPIGTDKCFFFSSQVLQLKVPKGSLPFPFLFKTHMKPLEDIVKWHRLQCLQYPDDTKLCLLFIEAICYSFLVSSRDKTWMKASWLELSIDKMKVMYGPGKENGFKLTKICFQS